MSRVSDHVLNLLAKITVEAKSANVEAVAMVTVGPDGRPVVHFAGAGELMPSIFLGVGLLHATIMQQAMSSPAAATMNSGLILPGTEH